MEFVTAFDCELSGAMGDSCGLSGAWQSLTVEATMPGWQVSGLFVGDDGSCDDQAF